ncbi:uncharacterized protein LOC124355611 [Homalodisca vitripennis]|uniref:uncharacterized protein LOC124355611 n=1 Tax=Homalodisca vitripennis TaxID=197043 RepID=UPI001EEBBA73|nr:uncharacterized protein LOC124355611 [Homalodisca vitripennis]
MWIGLESKDYLQEGDLRVATFNCSLFTIMDNNTGELTGIEAEIVKEVAARLNLTIRLVELDTSHTNNFGLKLQNGTWTGGVMGALYNREADVGFCALWTSVDRDEDVEHTTPWGTVDISFLVPRPHQKRENWQTFYVAFTLPTWLGILSGLVVVSVSHWSSLAVSSWISVEGTKTELTVILLGMFGVLTQSSSIPLKGRSLLVTSWHIFCMILVAAYSSNIVARLTLPMFTERIDSVQQLVTKGFTWGRPFKSNYSMLMNPQDVWHRRFMDFFRLVKREDMHKLISSKKFAFSAQVLERHYVFDSDFYKLQDNELVDLRVMAQVTNHFLVAIAVRRGSPVFPPANLQILRLLGTGLVDHWKRDISDRHGRRLVRELLLEKDKPTLIKYVSSRTQEEPPPSSGRECDKYFLVSVLSVVRIVSRSRYVPIL